MSVVIKEVTKEDEELKKKLSVRTRLI